MLRPNWLRDKTLRATLPLHVWFAAEYAKLERLLVTVNPRCAFGSKPGPFAKAGGI